MVLVRKLMHYFVSCLLVKEVLNDEELHLHAFARGSALVSNLDNKNLYIRLQQLKDGRWSVIVSTKGVLASSGIRFTFFFGPHRYTVKSTVATTGIEKIKNALNEP